VKEETVIVRSRGIALAVEAGDALAWPADVLALKYAQTPFGVDAAVLDRFRAKGVNFAERLPKPSGFYLTPSQGVVNTRTVLFIGVEPLHQFGYEQIRAFGRKVLMVLAGEELESRHIVLTVSGPGYGLDETEAFESLVAGLVDAVTSGAISERLERLTIIELDVARASRFSQALARLMPNGYIPPPGTSSSQVLGEEAAERLRSVGHASIDKPAIFVAMSFAEDMDDVFHYGIQGAVNAAGFLCERADLSSFTGDIMAWVKDRIANAALVIADLSGANPNVYLEVGYAWGCGRPTVLLVRNTSDLKFDIRGQRCLVYTSIRDLEGSLRRELANLQESLNR
jgi:hypothetical protein